MTCRSRATWGLYALLTAALFSGCGGADRPPIGYVSGTVTMDGDPFSGVIVSFSPDNGRPATGTTDEQGKYVLQYTQGVNGCKIGPNTATFFAPTGGTMSHSLPPEYQTTSEFKFDVKSGTNTFDIPLKSGKTAAEKPRKAPIGIVD